MRKKFKMLLLIVGALTLFSACSSTQSDIRGEGNQRALAMAASKTLKKPIIYKIITYVLILIISFIFFCALGNDKRKQAVKKDVKKHNMIYGLTIDDAWYDTTELEDVLQGLKYLKINLCPL